MFTIENANMFRDVDPSELEVVAGGDECGPLMLDLTSVAAWVETWVSHATSCYNRLK